MKLGRYTRVNIILITGLVVFIAGGAVLATVLIWARQFNTSIDWVRFKQVLSTPSQDKQTYDFTTDQIPIPILPSQ